MFLLRQPSALQVAQFISSQSKQPFSYPEVGGTRADTQADYFIDRSRVRLGEGATLFERGRAALKEWKHFDLGWAGIVPRGIEVKPGATVAVQAQTLGLWSLNACRIVYVIDEERRFAFAYGTLTDHAESGEERFMVERLDDDSVWYDIYAFSRPGRLLVKLGLPYARRLQKRFAIASLLRMAKATAGNE